MATVHGQSKSYTLRCGVRDATNDSQEAGISPHSNDFFPTTMRRNNAPNTRTRASLGGICPVISKSHRSWPMAVGRTQYSQPIHRAGGSTHTHHTEVCRKSHSSDMGSPNPRSWSSGRPRKLPCHNSGVYYSDMGSRYLDGLSDGQYTDHRSTTTIRTEATSQYQTHAAFYQTGVQENRTRKPKQMQDVHPCNFPIGHLHRYRRCSRTIHVEATNTDHEPVQLASYIQTDTTRMDRMATSPPTDSVIGNTSVTTATFRTVERKKQGNTEVVLFAPGRGGIQTRDNGMA